MTVRHRKSLNRLVDATKYSLQGLKAAFKSEQAFRQELYLTAVLVPLGLWLGNTGIERALLIGALILLLVVERLNTGLEAIVDRFGGEMHELSGWAKDAGSAAVMLSLINMVVIWVLVLLT